MTAGDAKLLHTVERNAFIDDLRHDATRQGAFDRAMLHLDHPLPGTAYYLRPDDHGASAEALYRDVEVTPLWRRLWNNAVARLPPTGRRVLGALMEDYRTAVAAKIAGVSRPTVDGWKKQFQKIFRPCFIAWKRDFGGK